MKLENAIIGGRIGDIIIILASATEILRRDAVVDRMSMRVIGKRSSNETNTQINLMNTRHASI